MKQKIIILVLFIFLLIQLVNASQYTHQDAVNAINTTEENINILKSSGYTVVSLEDSLSEAKLALQRAEFAELIVTNSSGELADNARKALEGLDYNGFSYFTVLDKFSC